MASSGVRMAEDDDYWDQSKASKLKSVGVNQFDDDIQDFKGIFKKLDKYKTVTDDDDGEADVINWDGTSTVSTEGMSVRYKADSVRNSGPSGISSVSSRPSSRPPHSGQVTSGISSKSIADVVSAQKPTNKTDVAKLEAEVNYLRRTVHTTKKERWVKLPPKETVNRIIYGQEFTLELYKGKDQKLELLDEAIKSYDGNAIIAAVLFLRDTVKTAIFNLELMLRPVAVDHYISFLRKAGETAKLMDVLGMLSRNEEAAMIKYRQACSVKDPEKKIKSLETCKNSHFAVDPNLGSEASMIEEQIIALSRQIPVEKADRELELKQDPRFKMLPRAASVVDQPVITWLFYCCVYHYSLSENNFASPDSIKKVHKLTDKQFLWTAVCARAKLKVWNHIDELFTTKGWLGQTKMKSPLGFHRVVQALNTYHAPKEILNKYCKLIEGSDRRLEVAQKLSCHETVIETLMYQKDRQQLINYQKTLKQNSQEWFLTQDVLRNTSVKWKN